MSMPPGMPPGMPPMPGMPLPMPYGMPPMMPGMMPIPGMYAYGAPHGMHQPPPPEDEPNAKRQKMEELNLIPEAKFLADYPVRIFRFYPSSLSTLEIGQPPKVSCSFILFTLHSEPSRFDCTNPTSTWRQERVEFPGTTAPHGVATYCYYC